MSEIETRKRRARESRDAGIEVLRALRSRMFALRAVVCAACLGEFGMIVVFNWSWSIVSYKCLTMEVYLSS